MIGSTEFRAYLEGLVSRFEQPSFIASDPVSIPHGFDDPRDQEVIALYAALLAWGQRVTMLTKLSELCERMRFRPHRFVLEFDESRDGPRLAGFGHRTFLPDDALTLTKALSRVLDRYDSLEAAFAAGMPAAATDVGPGIDAFSTLIAEIDPETPPRLRKHLARPSAGSACKRLNMFLRWMVRPGPVDLGIWSCVSRTKLVLPLDVHSGRQARRLGMLARTGNDWKAAIELTERCRMLDPDDPARFDFAFYGVGAHGVQLDPRFTTS